MSQYNLFAGVDANYHFPPEVRAALLESLNIRNVGAPMTTAQRNALPTTDLNAGDFIFNTQSQTYQVWRADFEDWHDGMEAPGSQKWWPGATIPKGWYKHDGRALLRSVYFALFAAISTTYGGSGTPLHFNLPNTSGRTMIDANGAHPLGRQGGFERVAITEGQMPRHQHGGTTNDTYQSHQHHGYVAGGGEHNHTYAWITTGNVNVTESGGNPVYRASRNNSVATGNAGSHGHEFWTDYTGETHSHPFGTDFRGNNESHENMQPFQAGHFIIKY